MKMQEFNVAWNSIVRLKVPSVSASSGISPSRLLAAYPVVGLFLGALLAVGAWFVRVMVLRPIAAAFIGGFLLSLLLLWLIRGRAFDAVCRVAHGLNGSNADNEPVDFEQVSMLLPAGWMVFVMFPMGVIIYDGAYAWLFLVSVFALTGYADALWQMERERLQRVTSSSVMQPLHWLCAICITLVVSMLTGTVALPEAALGLLVTWAMCFCAPWLATLAGGNANPAWLAFALIELAVLWVGVLTSPS